MEKTIDVEKTLHKIRKLQIDKTNIKSKNQKNLDILIELNDVLLNEYKKQLNDNKKAVNSYVKTAKARLKQQPTNETEELQAIILKENIDTLKHLNDKNNDEEIVSHNL